MGYNYRIVAVTTAGSTYGQYNKYTLYEGTNIILPLYSSPDSNWLTGYVQQTFSL
jgi:hypothetical protein